jgi:peptidoglycan L-alanyl-D-glutamate endopeptidase CwlK
MAVDVAPYPIDWSDLKRFYNFVGFVRGVASQMNIPIRVGADWDGDFHWKDQKFHDLPHFEIKGG